MKGFFKTLLAVVVGIFLSFTLILVVFIGIISAIALSADNQEVKIQPNSILKITLDKAITDRGNDNPLENFDLISMKTDNKLGLNDIIENIDKAITDDKIKGIYLTFSELNAGVADVTEIRNSLMKFKQSGKFIYCYTEYFSQKSYYLATVADKIYMNPEGTFLLNGMSAQSIFYKGLLDKIGVESQIIRKGRYKAAVEPYTLNKMSDENKEQTLKVINSIWNNFLDGISLNRNISKNQLNTIADSIFVYDAETAFQNKIIDSLCYEDQVLNKLKDLSGADNDSPRFISLENYFNSPKNDTTGYTQDKIAIVFGEGEIVSGKGDAGQIGSQTMSEAISKARKDKNVKAIVLRINSPGGSALASEIIWREVNLASAEKPVIASFGNLAASGGYYISCAADTIIANPGTITGSIGVFGIIPNAQKLLNEKLGINIDAVNTNTYSDMANVYRPLKDPERLVIQKSVDKVYKTFVSHVADGRKMNPEAVNEIGEGRIWSGSNAIEIGLVDMTGGLEDAIKIAASKAGLTKYRILELPEQKEFLQEILDDVMGGVETSVIQRFIGEKFNIFNELRSFKKCETIQARLPYNLIIE